MPDAAKDLFFPLWKMFLQPVLEQRCHGPWQTDNRVARKLRARFCARIEDLWNLMISESGNYGCNHDADWNVCCTKLLDNVKPTLRRRGARFEHSLQVWVKRRH